MTQSTATVQKQARNADEAIVPLHHPKRLPYHPSIPARELRKIVFRVVKARQTKERNEALAVRSHENAQ